MGTFMYEGAVTMDFEDRTLAHLQSVIGTKLRRGEAFHFTWKIRGSDRGRRTSVWLHPRCSLVYLYSGGHKPELNLAWVDALAHAANSPVGLYVVPEPVDAYVESPATDSVLLPEDPDLDALQER